MEGSYLGIILSLLVMLLSLVLFVIFSLVCRLSLLKSKKQELLDKVATLYNRAWQAGVAPPSIKDASKITVPSLYKAHLLVNLAIYLPLILGFLTIYFSTYLNSTTLYLNLISGIVALLSSFLSASKFYMFYRPRLALIENVVSTYIWSINVLEKTSTPINVESISFNQENVLTQVLNSINDIKIILGKIPDLESFSSSYRHASNVMIEKIGEQQEKYVQGIDLLYATISESRKQMELLNSRTEIISEKLNDTIKTLFGVWKKTENNTVISLNKLEAATEVFVDFCQNINAISSKTHEAINRFSVTIEPINEAIDRTNKLLLQTQGELPKLTDICSDTLEKRANIFADKLEKLTQNIINNNNEFKNSDNQNIIIASQSKQSQGRFNNPFRQK